MKIDFYKKSGEKDKSVEYPKFLESEISDQRILDYIKYVRNAIRDNIAHTKDKSEVSGGGKKPWKQKGTGRARHGSRRSPIWSGGGITFGPRNDQNFAVKMNKSERKKTMLAIMYSFVKNKKALGISDIALSGPKTSIVIGALEKLPIEGKFSLIFDKNDDDIHKSFRNIATCKAMSTDRINPISLLTGDYLLFTSGSLNKFIQMNQPKKIKQKVVATEVKND